MGTMYGSQWSAIMDNWQGRVQVDTGEWLGFRMRRALVKRKDYYFGLDTGFPLSLKGQGEDLYV